MTASDLTAALEALRITRLPFEGVFVATDATSTIVSAIDTWLLAREAEGRFKFGAANYVAKTAAQSEAQYLTAFTAAFAAVASIRSTVGYDAGAVVSPLTSWVQPRPAMLGCLAMAMANDIQVDPAYVALGAIPNFTILDDRGTPAYHDEAAYPGGDDVHATTLRTFPDRNGTFVTNARLLSNVGSDYVFLQHARVMNRACEIAFSALTTELGRGVRVNTDDHILEEDAKLLEASVQEQLDAALAGRVSGVAFTISRTDDIGSNEGAAITCFLNIASLKYIKSFTVYAGFVRSI